MDLDITLPDYGEFITPAGEKVEFWIDKKDRSKCKILVDGKPLDGKKYLEELEDTYGKKSLDI